MPKDLSNLQVLELGGRNGGLSKLFADMGAKVICSDISMPQNMQPHENIEYISLDATKINEYEKYDIIIFKSIIGAVGRVDKGLIIQVFEEIYKALKEGGILIFAENLQGSLLHRLMRRYFVRWGRSWDYQTLSGLEQNLRIFPEYRLQSLGYLGAFGLCRQGKKYFAMLDEKIEGYISPDARYIAAGWARK